MENVLNITRVLRRTSRSVMSCPCPILPFRLIHDIIPLNIWNPVWFIEKFLFSRAIIFVAISTPNSTGRDAFFFGILNLTKQPEVLRGRGATWLCNVASKHVRSCKRGQQCPFASDSGDSGRSPGMSLGGNVMAWELYASLGVTFRFIFCFVSD